MPDRKRRYGAKERKRFFGNFTLGRRRKTSREETWQLALAFDTWMGSVGAEPEGRVGYGDADLLFRYGIDTAYDRACVKLMAGSVTPWLHVKFDNPARSAKAINATKPGNPVNPYSGKFNLHPNNTKGEHILNEFKLHLRDAGLIERTKT